MSNILPKSSHARKKPPSPFKTIYHAKKDVIWSRLTSHSLHLRCNADLEGCYGNSTSVQPWSVLSNTTFIIGVLGMSKDSLVTLFAIKAVI